MFTLLKNADLYSPDYMGRSDILIGQGKVLAISPQLNVSGLEDLNTIDCSGKIVAPGLIDQHLHLTGGGGEAGFSSRTLQVTLSNLIKAGTTTAVGVLGTDGISRSPRDLYAKAAALCEEGLTAYMHTGSYEVPTRTITGSIRDDMAFVPAILGVKIALADHRCSFPTLNELSRIVSDIRVASLLAGKKGLLHVHMGNLPDAFAPLNELVKMGIPVHHLSPTHVARTENLFDEAISFALSGGYIDITSGGSRFTPPEQAAKLALDSGVDAKQITISSDGNGSLPKFDANGKLTGLTAASVDSNLLLLPKLVEQGIALELALAMLTSNVADSLGINKGRVQTGADADLCIFDSSLTLESVIARGNTLMLNNEILVNGNFE
ncbi:beta-aspartyl-peptidase [Vibrio sp. SCSIO 43137]|uniref:beta-aspartyl-peptidase n=1 Tax=Vibrio sp. SCSIO 43137 TaxID=3021011 RepID=UPI0023081FB8|nr:beta-aspartyl-peptidase [Vibrio sp. SCSIO 43137]WCE30836.1 beta-aspartyl-peptidase [Vibrio sp. SCSIO 43137]